MDLANTNWQHYWCDRVDGWVVVNSTAEPAHDVPVPQARARVLTHANFRDCSRTPQVARFDLPAHRGVVLLSEGRQAGNADNPMHERIIASPAVADGRLLLRGDEHLFCVETGKH
jgi:hypothetical protein